MTPFENQRGASADTDLQRGQGGSRAEQLSEEKRHFIGEGRRHNYVWSEAATYDADGRRPLNSEPEPIAA
jgi:hypothetical protein